MERTLDYVSPNIRDWTNGDGKTFYFVEANFDDGSSGSVFCFSKANADETLEALRKLVGASYEYELEAGKVYNGQQQWKIKNFPGKPAGGGGGGSRSGGGGMSHAQVGLLAAATVLAPLEGTNQEIFEHVVELGEMFTEHLFSRRKSDDGEASTPTEVTPSPSVASAAPAPADAITLVQMKRLKELGGDSPENLARFGIERLTDLSKDEAEGAIALLEG